MYSCSSICEGTVPSQSLPGKAHEEKKRIQKQSIIRNRRLNPLCYNINKYSITIYVLQYYEECFKVTVLKAPSPVLCQPRVVYTINRCNALHL